jgi:hypothetical protein
MQAYAGDVHLVQEHEAGHQITIGYYGQNRKIGVSCTCRAGCAPLAVAVRLPAKEAIAAFKAHLARLAEPRSGRR